MILSQKHKVLYVAVPKTATTAVQNWLLKENLEFNKGKHLINGRTIMLREHITAIEAKELLSSDYYDELNVIAFIRYPYSRMVSAYNFYRGGAKTGSILSKNTKDKKKRILHSFQILIARMFPFWLWALIYPYRDNKQYCIDDNNELIVTHVGIYEDLVNNMALFLKEIGLKANINNLAYLNKSTKKASDDFIKNKLIQKLMLLRHKKLKEDLKFYEEIINKHK